MIDYLAIGTAAGVGLAIILCIWCLVVVYRVKTLADGIGSTRPVKPTPKLIRHWRRRLSQCHPGTPKYKAYRQRLLDAGQRVPDK